MAGAPRVRCSGDGRQERWRRRPGMAMELRFRFCGRNDRKKADGAERLGGQTGLQKIGPGDPVHSLSEKVGEALASGEEMWMVGAGTPDIGNRADQMCGPETGS